MGLFVKKPIFDSNAPLYSLGLNTTILIVGLGNPGKEYDGTRHNIGFAVVDHFVKKQKFDNWILKKDMHSAQTGGVIGSARVIIIKPTTFMNESGRAVKETQNFYKVDNSKTLVIHDELDLHFGHIRTRVGGSSAGHNGIKSVTRACGENYGRMRIGIGEKKHHKMETNDFVLGMFEQNEAKHIPALLQESNAILSEYAHATGELLAETRNFIV